MATLEGRPHGQIGELGLTSDPIPKLVRHLAVPASVGFFFNTMYNVVDTYFAGRVSTEALAALSLSFPIFFSIIAMGVGISQGSTALIANALGAENTKAARCYTVQAIGFGCLFSLLLTGLGLAIAPFLFRLLGASENYLAISLAYMNMILLGTLFFLLQSILNASLNAQGDTRSYRNVLIAGFLLNLVLDPWFLYGGLGLPAMGIRGIALATVVIQIFGSVYLGLRLHRTPLVRGLCWRDFRPDLKAYRDIAGQGLPASFNMLTVALGIFVITYFISRFSTEGVAAYGIATRIEQIVLMPTIGLNIAVLSIVGQNYGAGRLDRVRKAWSLSMKYGLWMMSVGGLFMFVLARRMMSWFTGDSYVIQIGTEYLHIAAFILAAYPVLYQTIFMLQGLKRPMFGLWIGIYRQIVGPGIVFYLLAFALV